MQRRDVERVWPERLKIRDTGLHDDLGGPGQRIYTTAGRGYERAEYVRADLYDALLAERDAALAAAPQPAPDRETLESIFYNSADAYIEEHDRRAIADALLARGLRLPGGDETMAWAVVGEDGEVIPGSIYPTRDEAEQVCDYEGERVVRVAIRVVDGGDDAA